MQINILKNLLAAVLFISLTAPVSAANYLSCGNNKNHKSLNKLIAGKAKVKARKIKARKNTPSSFGFSYLLIKIEDEEDSNGNKELCNVELGNQVLEIQELEMACNTFETRYDSYYLSITDEEASGDAYLDKVESSGKTVTTLAYKKFEKLERDSLIYTKVNQKRIYIDYTDAEIAKRTKKTGTWSLDFANLMTYRDQMQIVGPEEKWFCKFSTVEEHSLIKEEYNLMAVPFFDYHEKVRLKKEDQKKREKEEQQKANKI